MVGISVTLALCAREAQADEDSGSALRSGIIAGSAAVGAWTLGEFFPAPSTCRVCGSNALDRGARGELVWKHPKRAAELSDVLVSAIPVTGATASFLIGQRQSIGQGLTDAFVVAEAVLVASFGTQLAKMAAQRRRPYAYYGIDRYPDSKDQNRAFWSGHSAAAFSAVASLTTIAYHHRWVGAPWIGAGGALAAGSVGYLRIGADKHWLTDVLAGGAFGTAVGIAVPLLELGAPQGDIRVAATLMPIGIAGQF